MSEDPPKKQRIPPGVVKPGTLTRHRRRPGRSFVLPVVGVVVVVLLALAIVGSFGSSDNGGKATDHAEKGKKSRTGTTTSETPAAIAGQTTTAPGSGASVELRSTDTVWVCLVDDAGNKLVNSETLSSGEKRGPFTATGFDVTFGNGSVQMTVNGQPSPVPAAAQPIGYRITSSGVKKLSPSAQPTCV